jgi:hypothetical protein
MNLTFFDQSGTAVAYSEDEQTIYLFDGRPVAYLDDDSAYSFSGEHLGWYLRGWILDNVGYCILFTDNASGGPFKPFKGFKPFKDFKKSKPIKEFKKHKPQKQSIKSSWSDVSAEEFFRI